MSWLPPMSEWVPGSTVGGRYVIRGSLGFGGMAAVFHAFDPLLKIDVALKALPHAIAQDPAFLERFRREAQALAAMTHPNVLRLYDIGEDSRSGTQFLVLEHLAGGTLRDRLVGEPIAVPEAIEILRPIAAALDYAHRRSPAVVHRDLKPSNILFDADGRVVVADFGLARLMAPDGSTGPSEWSTLTAAQLLGTPAYMAPEHIEGKPVTPASDLYALAVIAYEMLVGVVPYQADTPVAVLMQVITKPLPHPRDLNPDLDPSVERALLRALAKEPRARFPSGEAFMEALQGICEAGAAPVEPNLAEVVDGAAIVVARGNTIHMPGRPPGPAEPAEASPAWPTHWKRLAATVGGAIVLATAVGLAGWTFMPRAPTESAPTELALAPIIPTATAILSPSPTRSLAVPARTAAPAPVAATATATSVPPTATSRPSPTPSADERWAAAQGRLDSLWGQDWDAAIDLLDGFIAREPGYVAAEDKLYAALVEAGKSRLEDGDEEGGVALLQRAQDLRPDRSEAESELLALTPTPEPPPVAPARPAAPVRSVVNSAAPAPVVQSVPAEPAVRPTKAPVAP